MHICLLGTDLCKAPLDEDSLAPLDEDKTRPLGRHDRSNGRHFVGAAIQGDARYSRARKLIILVLKSWTARIHETSKAGGIMMLVYSACCAGMTRRNL